MSTTHEVLERTAKDLGWGFDCKIVLYYETKRFVLTKGQYEITVYLNASERVMSAYRRRVPGELTTARIRGGRKAIIKVMKELS